MDENAIFYFRPTLNRATAPVPHPDWLFSPEDGKASAMEASAFVNE